MARGSDRRAAKPITSLTVRGRWHRNGSPHATFHHGPERTRSTPEAGDTAAVRARPSLHPSPERLTEESRYGLLDPSSSIGIAAVANSDDVDHPTSIVQAVDDAVVADADAPQISGTMQLARASWSWVASQSLDPRDDSLDNRRVECLQFLAGGSSEDDGIVRHRAAACVHDVGGASHLRPTPAARPACSSQQQRRRSPPKR